MARTIVVAIVLVVALSVAGSAGAALTSKTYQFKQGVLLEVGAPVEGGLRIDTVLFSFPTPSNRRVLRLGGQARAEVAVSNGSERSRRAGIAIALFDAQGRLLAVASGGSALLPIKPGRQSTYTLVFSDVNAHVHDAASFQISVEPR